MTVPNKALHPNNLHRKAYDFELLAAKEASLEPYIIKTAQGNLSIDYALPEAVIALNKALLAQHYGIQAWGIPEGSLCPPIPGRVDYLHYVADLFVPKTNKNSADTRHVLDIGTGANGIYALLAYSVFGWNCVASDIEQSSLNNVAEVLSHNPNVERHVALRLQHDKHKIFEGIIETGEYFDISVCNPPFHASAQDALRSAQQKFKNIAEHRGSSKPKAKSTVTLNFGGQSNELWCNGGERLFVKKMIKESAVFSEQCRWFTTLISKAENLKPSLKLINKLGASDTRVIDMQQGNKQTRILAWSFY